MTISELLEQAMILTPKERKELAILLIDTLAIEESPERPPNGAEILALLENMEPIEFVDNDIKDPVEWLRAQRQKDADRLKPYMSDDNDERTS